MLHVKSCNVKHNSESVFRYISSAVTTAQNVIEKIFMVSVVIEAFKKSVMVLCKPFGKSLLGIQRLGFISTCIAHQPD